MRPSSRPSRLFERARGIFLQGILWMHCLLANPNALHALFRALFFLCHPERSRGTPDFFRCWKVHPNHASSDVFGARSVVEGESAGIQKDPGSLGYARDDTRTKIGERPRLLFA